MSDAILEEYTVEENLSGMRLDKFLTEIYPEQLKYYEECFVTNSLMGIMPVTKLGEITFPERTTADKLRMEYMKIL